MLNGGCAGQGDGSPGLLRSSRRSPEVSAITAVQGRACRLPLLDFGRLTTLRELVCDSKRRLPWQAERVLRGTRRMDQALS